jgi:hypothetical protein
MLLRILALFVFSSLALNPASGQKNKTISPPPLVRMTPNPPPIQVVESNPSWTFGGWTTSDYGSFTMASTINESRSGFGAVCGKECVWFINFRIECDQGHEYPGMLNSPSGSYAINLRCYHLGDHRLMIFSMDDDSVELLAKPGEIGFAVPLESGKFGVSRFTLSGGAQAVEKAMSVIVSRQQSNQEGLRDFTI